MMMMRFLSGGGKPSRKKKIHAQNHTRRGPATGSSRVTVNGRKGKKERKSGSERRRNERDPRRHSSRYPIPGCSDPSCAPKLVPMG